MLARRRAGESTGVPDGTPLGSLQAAIRLGLIGLVAVPAFPLMGISSAAGAECAQVEPVGLLPAREVCLNWPPIGEPSTAHTFQELTQLVDGAASRYAEHGFVSAAVQNYQSVAGHEPVDATVSLFNQSAAANAAGLYEELDEGLGVPIADWTGTGPARLLTGFGYFMIQFCEECFFVSVVATSDSEEALQGARCLADAICASIQTAVPAERPTWGRIKILYSGRRPE